MAKFSLTTSGFAICPSASTICQCARFEATALDRLGECRQISTTRTLHYRRAVQDCGRLHGLPIDCSVRSDCGTISA